MKKIAVVALLAVCACVRASVDFTPHKLPCEYTIIQETNTTEDVNVVTSVTNTIYIHGTFAAVYSEITAPSPVFNEILLRIDLADYQTDEVEVFQVHTAGSDNCSSLLVDRNQAWDYINTHILATFQDTLTFDSVSDGSFEGTPCKVYYLKETGTDVFLFADKDNYIIGYNTSSGENFTAARVKYEMKAPLEKFVVDGKKYPGCSKYASVTPVVDECTDIKFRAKELPCEFIINADNDYFDSNGQEYKVKDSLIFHGDFKSIFINQETPVKYFSKTVVRSDVNDSISVAVYSYHSTEDKCVQEMVSKGIVDDQVKTYLAVFENEWIFHAKAEGTFKGKKVTIYYTNTNGTELMFFVDKDNYVIGLNTSSTDGTQTSSFSYSWKAPLNKFALDNSYKGCNSTAYKTPSYDPCGDEKSSSASTVVASFALIVVSVIFALL